MEIRVEEKKGAALPRWADMSLVMLKIGLFTFGGGWSIIAQMQKEFVEKRGWLTEEELLDIVAMARSFPGIMVTNASVMMGYSIGGPAYAVLCALCVAAPAFAVMCLVTVFYILVRDNPYVSRAMVGVRAAVVPIILSATLSLRKTAIRDWIGLGIAAAAFLLFLFTDINNIWIVLLGGGSGLLIQTLHTGRAAQARQEGGEGNADHS